MNKVKPLPQYKCHKVVGALTIASITLVQRSKMISEYELTFVEEGYPPISVSDEWYRSRKPKVGGMYVSYKDGYTSYSPKGEFDDGYTAIPNERVLENMMSVNTVTSNI